MWDALINQASQQVQSSHFSTSCHEAGTLRAGAHRGGVSPRAQFTSRRNRRKVQSSRRRFSERGTGFTLTSLVSATEFDLTRADSEGAECGGAGPRQESTSVDSDSDQCDVLSSTESCRSVATTNCQRRRRLRPVWGVHHTTQWHRGARAADEFIQNLARSVGSVPDRADATGADNANAVVDWLTHKLTGAPQIGFHESVIDADVAVHTGWTTLRDVFRRWSIHEHEDLTTWLRQHGYAESQPGNHFPARAQEHMLAEACRVDRQSRSV